MMEAAPKQPEAPAATQDEVRMLQLHGDDPAFHAQLKELYVAEWPRHGLILQAVLDGASHDELDLYHHMHMLVSLTGNLALRELEVACRHLHDLLRQKQIPDDLAKQVAGILSAGNQAAAQFRLQLDTE